MRKKKIVGKKTTRDRVQDVIVEMATALHRTGDIDTVTLREYEQMRAPKVKVLKAKEIKHIRVKIKVSQAVFAKLLNISPETVRKWEQGDRHPTGSSLKLLNLVSAHGLQALY